MNARATWAVFLSLAIGCLLFSTSARGEVDLLERYPTKLAGTDANPEHARAWEFDERDIFKLTQFRFSAGGMHIEMGPAVVGLGHCADGAVWAVVYPKVSGLLSSEASRNDEPISHVWLRFHPGIVNKLFPAGTVIGEGSAEFRSRMQRIANAKMFSSWQSGGKAMIPGPNEMTVDIDTKGGARRFFIVDRDAGEAKYTPAFENRPVRDAPAITPELATEAFDKLWSAFDEKYAMFAIRPGVDWNALRERYRPMAIASKSTEDFAKVCAEMLRQLRDLHVWLTVAGDSVPVFNRPRFGNVNPRAAAALLGKLNQENRVGWAVTTNNIGYLAIYGWDNDDIPDQCDKALEAMRDTRALIVDVRMNGGGAEPLAQKVAGRFLRKEFAYGFDQMRNGPSHTNLTEKMERSAQPRGPWRYSKPVLLLIGQRCMSSDESFIGMMTGDPQLTTMGDRTCGSSGNPEIIKLPLDMTVSVPRWIDYLPDVTLLDERGFQPQIPFTPSPTAFEMEKDDLLAAALAEIESMLQK